VSTRTAGASAYASLVPVTTTEGANAMKKPSEGLTLPVRLILKRLERLRMELCAVLSENEPATDKIYHLLVNAESVAQKAAFNRAFPVDPSVN
jgi:hypothetical protein